MEKVISGHMNTDMQTDNSHITPGLIQGFK